MTERCHDCGRPSLHMAPNGHGCAAFANNKRNGALAADLYPSMLAECQTATIARLRRELANALSIANSRTYCMDSPEVLKARVGELEKELAEAQSNAARWTGESVTMAASAGQLCNVVDGLRAELAEAQKIAFPPTHNEQGPEDSDEVCDACSHSAEHGKHTYKDCLANHLADAGNVTGLLQEENARLEKELANARHQLSTSLDAIDVRDDCLEEIRRKLAEARAIGVLERDVVSAAIDWDNEEEDTVEAVLLLSAAVDALTAARAPTGEPKEAT